MAEPARQLEAHDEQRWLEWVSAAEAAQALGVNRDAFTRRCRDSLQARGLAFHGRGPAGGPPRWWVHRDYDARLGDGRVFEVETPGPLAEYTERQRLVAFTKKRCVDLYRDARASKPGRESDWIGPFIDHLRDTIVDPLNRDHGCKLKISHRSLMRWASVYKRPADIENLVDARGGNQRAQGDPAAWDYFRHVFLDERKPTKRTCWKWTKQHAARAGLTWCSYRSCIRQLDHRIPPETQAYHRDPRLWRSKFAPYEQQDPERFGAGECYVGDHRPMDLLCKVETPRGVRIFRPIITAWQDWRTRRIVGWELSETPNSSTILAALRSAIMDEANKGGPSQVIMDNGKDFDSYTFTGRTKQQRKQRVQIDAPEAEYQGVFGLLGIEVSMSLPFNPQGKARMERWFATVGDQFDKTFDTYTGPDTTRKPERLKQVMNNANRIPTFQHVRERFGQFVRLCNADADHSIDDLIDGDGQRLSPDAAMARWRQNVRAYADPGSLDLLLQKITRPQRVGRQGVRVTIAGQTWKYGAHDPALIPYKNGKRSVRVTYDPDYLAYVNVYDEQWRFLCAAACNDPEVRQAGITENQARRAARKKNAHKRHLRKAQQGRMTEILSPQELAADEAREDEQTSQIAAQRNEQTGNVRLVQTPVDGQSKRVQSRRAAGAEHDAHGEDDDEGLPSVLDLSPMERLAERRMRGEDEEDDEPLRLGDDDWPMPRWSDHAPPEDDEPDQADMLDQLAEDGREGGQP